MVYQFDAEGQNESDEGIIISDSDAVIEPYAVMVEAHCAPVASAAVLGLVADMSGASIAKVFIIVFRELLSILAH